MYPSHEIIDLTWPPAATKCVLSVNRPPFFSASFRCCPKVDAVVAAGDRHRREGLAVEDRLRGRRLEVGADRNTRLEPPGGRRDQHEVVVARLCFRGNADLPGLVTHLCREDGRDLGHRVLHRKLRKSFGTHRWSVNSISAFVTSQPRASSCLRHRVDDPARLFRERVVDDQHPRFRLFVHAALLSARRRVAGRFACVGHEALLRRAAGRGARTCAPRDARERSSACVGWARLRSSYGSTVRS